MENGSCVRPAGHGAVKWVQEDRWNKRDKGFDAVGTKWRPDSDKTLVVVVSVYSCFVPRDRLRGWDCLDCDF